MQSARQKRRQPANDYQNDVIHKIPFVILRKKPRWIPEKLFAASALLATLFVLVLAFTVGMPVQKEPVLATTKAALLPPSPQVEAKKEPYDIVLKTSELASDDGQTEEKITEALPRGAVQERHATPGLQIMVEDDDTDDPGADETEQKASSENSRAQALARDGDLDRALEEEHRAVELSPRDMGLRLKLAVLYDRAGMLGGAATLYRQVVRAYEHEDETLPPDFNVAPVRDRLNYISFMARE